NVYTANLHDNTVARFIRNGDGTLNWGGILRDGVNGADGLGSARGRHQPGRPVYLRRRVHRSGIGRIEP
ncbi:MAG: hypothetical protein IPF56_12010, partial [Chloroflexi bacterium]|nr:hypothetical protein [Chloroflexota bacterium]